MTIREGYNKQIKPDPLNSKIEYEDTYAQNGLSEVSPIDIDISSDHISLNHLFEKLRKGEISLKTGFQRNNIWSNTQQSRLIESILVRIPIPAFYFDGSKPTEWLIIDGQQRITTFNNFIINQTLILENLEYLPNLNGCKYDGLPRDFQRRILETEVPIFLINPGTPISVKYNIFHRINTGGTSLNSQEIRNALNHGSLADSIIKELSQLKIFKKVTDGAVSADRMEDQYIVSRFIAFYVLEYKNYKPELEKFLNTAITRLNELSESKQFELKQQFTKAMNLSWKIFGTDAFRKRFNSEDVRNPFNKALFEAWSVNFANLSDIQIERLIEKKEFLKDLFMQKLNTDKSFLKSISSGTGDTKSVQKRFEIIHQIIHQIIK